MADKVLIKSKSIIVSKDSSAGIKVDESNPEFTWMDLEGIIAPDPAGLNSPTLAPLSGGAIRGYFYAVTDKIDMKYHIPHCYVKGSDMYIHVHWSHNGTAISGNNVMDIYLSYAKGHNQMVYTPEILGTITVATVDIATTPQGIHRIDEIQISTPGGGPNLLDSNDLEVDGVIRAAFVQNAIPTITGGSRNEPIVDTIDLHMLSRSIGTKNKTPNFYV